jgi:hypothetical protein
MTQSPASTCTFPALNAAFAVWISAPCFLSSLTMSAALYFARCEAGTTQPYTGPFLPLSTARLFFSQ